ncbi:MAG TPA: ABC transporter ATP-binding protein [Geminicoccus sp.]|uniref:ABC transporter ATP-binding protein n=1 Tax=Geminicoccus sp. TaxID=2024832 RepID=UPI002B52ABFE|nr:ABC transporter ATP-binding protein [Geminicoccus sp.]HWL67051.1 ABC transporter ATP-binding protein [Geminicoccus sp.]
MSNGVPIVRFENIEKSFGSFKAVDGVTLDVPNNSFFALLGPSGCGKTTLLRMLAGFEYPTSGRILIDGEDMAGIPPNKRPVNMVFQSYAVFPHMTVRENVGYGLKVSGVPKSEIEPRVEEAIQMVRLDGFADRKPDKLSGGQRQRVALARALVKKPKLLLLDEPLSALDKKLREDMQLELVRLQQEVGISFVIVTHDQDEALSMADLIAVMNRGKVLQVAPPWDLYEEPNCRFVADFIGEMNLFEGRMLSADGGQARLDLKGIGLVDVPWDYPPTSDVALAVRPEKMRLYREEPELGWVRLPGKVAQVAYFGDNSQVFVETSQAGRVVVLRHNQSRSRDEPYRTGADCWVAFEPTDGIVLSD